MRAAPHDLTLTRLSPSVPDAEGRGREQPGASQQAKGRLMMLSARETEEARRLVENVTAVAHVGVGTQVGGEPVDEHCQVEQPGAPPKLAGRWDVAAVRHTPAHLRLLLRRPKRLRGRT